MLVNRFDPNDLAFYETKNGVPLDSDFTVGELSYGDTVKEVPKLDRRERYWVETFQSQYDAIDWYRCEEGYRTPFTTILDDEEFAYKMLTEVGISYDIMPTSVWNSSKFQNWMMNNVVGSLKYMPEMLKDNKNVVKKFVEVDTYSFRSASDRLQNDHAFVLELVIDYELGVECILVKTTRDISFCRMVLEHFDSSTTVPEAALELIDLCTKNISRANFPDEW